MIKRIPFWIPISLLVVAIIIGSSLWATRGLIHADGDWNWSSSDQWGNWGPDDERYTIYNDIWGNGAGPQTIFANSHSRWEVQSDQPDTGGVKSYPNVTKDCGDQPIDSLSSVTSHFSVSVPNSGSYNTAYDIWVNNNADEIMLWMNKTGDVGPLGDLQMSGFRSGGYSWDIYKGYNGDIAVFSYVISGDPVYDGNVDILSILKDIEAYNQIQDMRLNKVQLGYEITSSSGGLTFDTNDFSVTC